ncbi:MAG: hypothetical protein OHK0022_40850 [Roseiflexaceae bacterium]
MPLMYAALGIGVLVILLGIILGRSRANTADQPARPAPVVLEGGADSDEVKGELLRLIGRGRKEQAVAMLCEGADADPVVARNYLDALERDPSLPLPDFVIRPSASRPPTP